MVLINLSVDSQKWPRHKKKKRFATMFLVLKRLRIFESSHFKLGRRKEKYRRLACQNRSGWFLFIAPGRPAQGRRNQLGWFSCLVRSVRVQLGFGCFDVKTCKTCLVHIFYWDKTTPYIYQRITADWNQHPIEFFLHLLVLLPYFFILLLFDTSLDEIWRCSRWFGLP